jgi:hypothetical protein
MNYPERQYGHDPKMAFTDGSDYWLSEGYANPTLINCYPYIQGSMPSCTLDRIEVKLAPETYKDLLVRPNPALVCYLSVYADGRWQGHTIINYQAHTIRGNRRNYHTVRAGESLDSIRREELYWGFGEAAPNEWWPPLPGGGDIYSINEDIIGRYPHIRLYAGMKIRLPYKHAPGEPPMPDAHGDIPYLFFSWLYDSAASKDYVTLMLPQPISRVTKVRLSFWNIGRALHTNPPWRVGVRSMVAYAAWDKAHPTPLPEIPPGDPGTSIALPPGSHIGTSLVPTYRWNGSYSDYTDIVKLFCAWGGLYWPPEAKMPLSDGTYADFPIPGKKGDSALTYTLPGDQVKQIFYVTPEGIEESYSYAQDRRYPNGYVRYLQSGGRVWGDLETTGTTGIVEFPIDQFDKKPLADGINLVRDTIGFVFFIDETGGVIWRLPNYYSVGNWIMDPPWVGVNPLPAGPWTPDHRGRTRNMYSIDEKQVIIGLRAVLTGTNIRDRIFISTVDGKFGAAIKGFNPFPTGMRRVAGWTDQYFQSTAECLRMAQMIAMRQMFSYRNDQITIPGFPGIQIDDQVEIVETVTGEKTRDLPQAWGVVPKRRGTVHYVRGIQSSLDMETGEWTYNLATHWLGVHPDSLWVFNPNDLLPETKAFIQAVNQSPANPYVPSIPPLKP